ncbi:MAG: transposase [Dehalococcoidia bacterium]|nr:transposase [Dehalococcoidia bacterium]
MLADRYYPSSRTCSACGVFNAKLKRQRYWRCGSCGTKHDRNLNAAVK